MQKGFTPIIILIGILVLAGVGAWYAKVTQIPNLPPPGCYYKKVQCIKAPCYPVLMCGTPSANPAITSPVTPLPSPVTDETANPDSIGADWKTYTNSQYKYSLQYPPDWSVTSNARNLGNDGVLIWDHKSYPKSPNDIEPDGYFIVITNYGNPNHHDFKDVVTVDTGTMTDDIKQMFTYEKDYINGQPVFRSTTLPSMGGCEWVFFKRKDDSYVGIRFCLYNKQQPYPHQDEYYPIFNKILATFKFLN